MSRVNKKRTYKENTESFFLKNDATFQGPMTCFLHVSIHRGQQHPHTPSWGAAACTLSRGSAPVCLFFPVKMVFATSFHCMKRRRWGDGEGSGNDTGSTLSSLASRLRLTAARPSGYSERVLLEGQRHMGWGSCLVGGDCKSLKGKSKAPFSDMCY